MGGGGEGWRMGGGGEGWRTGEGEVGVGGWVAEVVPGPVLKTLAPWCPGCHYWALRIAAWTEIYLPTLYIFS